ncbi:MAG: hypothetical protein Q9174_006362 [Haloplaca sp. 1 TL-2023]
MHTSFNASVLLALSVITSSVSGVALHHAHRHRALTCYEDNTLRALERFSSDAAAYCPKLLSSSSQQIPGNLGAIPASKLSSACTCFMKTAAPANPVSTPPTSPTSTPIVVPTSTKAPIQTVSASAQPISTPSSTSSLAEPTSTPAAGANGKAYNGGKRGLVYDYKSKDYSKYFKDSNKISFGSNWNLNRSPAPGVDLNYAPFVPTIRVDGGLKNDKWAGAVKSLISSGTPMIFASNEPDNAGQANISPAQAATVYKSFIQPFKGQVALAAPAITNGGGNTGLGFLEKFVAECQDCHFDIINVHHYVNRKDLSIDQAVSAVKTYLTKDVAAFLAGHPKQFGGARICVGEFWLWGASDEDGAEYLRKLLPWLDAEPSVAAYQAFGGLWPGNFIKNDGSGLSKSGQVYHDL